MKVFSFFALLCLAANLAPAQSAPVDWQTLATEFSQDEAAASNKYQGQMITVTGPVSGIAQGDMTTDNPAVAVTLSTPAGPGPDVKCLFQNEDLAPNSEIYVPSDGSEAILRKRDNVGNVISSEPPVTLCCSTAGWPVGRRSRQDSRSGGRSPARNQGLFLAVRARDRFNTPLV